MKAFITGATGYIGEHVALALKGQGHEVVALVRSEDKAHGLKSAGISLLFGDLQRKETIHQGMAGCDVVFHLAAYASVWPEQEDIFREINVEGTRNILDAAVKQHVSKVIVTSTAGVYGPSPAPAPTVDETTRRSVPYFNAYETTKAAAEALCRTYSKNGLHVVMVNPPRVYGPGRKSESNAVTKLIELYIKGKWHYMPGDGTKMGSYSYIDDIVAGHLKAWEKGRSGENYLLGGENASYEEFFGTIAQLSGKNVKLYKIPVPVMVFAARLMVIWSKVTRSKPLITPQWVKKYLFHWSVSSEKAIDELGYTITPLRKGIQETLNWLNEDAISKKYTLITGASAGIGKAMAEECASRKLNLLLVALPDTGLLQVANQLQQQYHIDAKILELNLTDTAAMQYLYDWCEEQQLSIDVLINNAGVGNCSAFESTSLCDYMEMIQLNTQTVVSLTRLFIPKLRQHQQSYILNVGSLASLMPVPYKSVYSATKSFVYTFSRSLQIELMQFGIHVSCLCPGPTETKSATNRSALMGQKSKMLMLSAETVAKIAIEGMYNQKGLIIPGWKSRMVLKLNSLIPFSIKGYWMEKMFKDGVEKKGAPLPQYARS